MKTTFLGTDLSEALAAQVGGIEAADLVVKGLDGSIGAGEIQGNARLLADLAGIAKDAWSGNALIRDPAFASSAFGSVADRFAGSTPNIGIGIAVFNQHSSTVTAAYQGSVTRFEMIMKAFETNDMDLARQALDFNKFGRETFSNELPAFLQDLVKWAE